MFLYIDISLDNIIYKKKHIDKNKKKNSVLKETPALF
jgi:hypothetical protein